MNAKGRQHKGYSPNDSLYTPPHIFDALNVTFDMDVCSPKGGLPWIPALEFIDEETDGLITKWFGMVWMNPPYSNPTPWIDKWIKHGNGFALTPSSTGKWFIKLWDSSAMCVALEHGSTLFVNTNGEYHGIFMPKMLWAIGEQAITVLKSSEIGLVR